MCIPLCLGLSTLSQADDSFVISYWCGPRPDQDPSVRYAEVAECNFTHCLPPCGGVSVEQNKAILDACEKNGLKYIIPDSRIMAKKPEDPDFAANLDAVIADYAGHSATGGYFLTDEPNASAFPWLAAVNQYLLKKDPKHLPYINLFPNYANEQQLGNPTYEEHVEQFCSVVRPKLLSYDHYALINDGTERPIYFENMEIVRRQGLKHGIPMCFILLVVPHGPYRDPSEAEIRWQVYTALAYGAKAILYFTYWTPHGGDAWRFRNGIITYDGERTEHFNQVKRINAELKVLGPILMKLTSTGVYHTGEAPLGCRAPEPGLPVRVTNDVPVVLGMFKHRDGSAWAMIVNRDMRKPAHVDLAFDKLVNRVQDMSPKTGVLIDLKLGEGSSLSLDLRAGEGRLLKLAKTARWE